MSGESRSLALRYFREFVNKHDLSVLRELCSPQRLDHDFTEELSPAPEYAQQRHRNLGNVFSDVHDDIEAMVATDDMVAVRVLGTGIHSGELFGVPATGKQVTWTATMIWRISDGKFVERWNAFDSLSQMLQLDTLPALKHVVIPAQHKHMPLQSDEESSKDQTTEDTQGQLKPLWQFLEALRTGNLAILEDVVAPEYIDHGGWIDGLPAGSQGLQQEVMILRRAFPDLEITVQQLFAAEKYAVLMMKGAGTQRGEFFGIPATNKHTSWISVGIYRVEQGKIMERWIDATRLPLLRQLGVIPPVPMEVLPILRPETF